MSTSSTTRAQATERGKRGRGAGSGAGPDRMPVPTRQRRPGLAALAIVLILGGAALSGYLVLTSGDKTAVVIATGEIKAGQPVTDAILGEAQVAADTNVDTDLVPYSQVSDLVGKVAKGTIPEGTLINAGMVEAPKKSSCVEVPFALQQGNFVAAGPGDVVKLFFHAKEEGSTVPPELAEGVYVTSVKTATTTAGSGVVVTVLAKPGGSSSPGTDAAIAEANQTGTITMVKVLDADPAQAQAGCGLAATDDNGGQGN